jgi:phage shock protein A
MLAHWQRPPNRGHDVSALTAIGSPAIAASQSGASKTALRAELTRYEKQRTECVNCSSARTIEGKRNIQNLDSQIDTLKAKLTVVAQSHAPASASEARSSTAPSAAGRIDVYA